MQAAQSRAVVLTLVRESGFTAQHMQRLVLVLIGLVLIERAYVRTGG